jgi:hypothetical protein
MQISRFIGMLCFCVLGLGPTISLAKTGRQTPSYSEKVQTFLSPTDSPILFVGKIVGVDPNLLPCTIQNTRATTWSVSRVLYGFDPGKQIDIGFGSCGGVEAQFKSRNEMLVITYPAYPNRWIGMTESVVPATDANVKLARKAMNVYLRKKIRKAAGPSKNGDARQVLIFEGTIVKVEAPPGNGPCPSGVPPTFQTVFDIDHILWGGAADNRVTVLFAGCRPLPGPAYRTGQKVIVFALRMDPRDPFVRGEFLLPLEQKAEVVATLSAGEAVSNAGQPPPDAPLNAKINYFVQSAHDKRVSILVFAGTIVSPVPEHRTTPCIVKSMPSFRIEIAVEQVLAGKLEEKPLEHASVVFGGCDLPPGSNNYQTGGRAVVFAVVANGGEISGLLLAPAAQIAEAKSALDAALHSKT